jgi:hypothetical protein
LRTLAYHEILHRRHYNVANVATLLLVATLQNFVISQCHCSIMPTRCLSKLCVPGSIEGPPFAHQHKTLHDEGGLLQSSYASSTTTVRSSDGTHSALERMRSAAAAAVAHSAANLPSHRRAGELTEAALLRHERLHAPPPPLPCVGFPRQAAKDGGSGGGGKWDTGAVGWARRCGDAPDPAEVPRRAY